MNEIADNLSRVTERLESACHRSGRDPSDVRLMAVGKRQPLQRLQAAYDAGHRLFGENRVQEAVQKIPELPADIDWHLIGHLQSNKVKDVIGRFSTVQSLDRIKIAEALQRRVESEQNHIDVYVEVNTSGEETKFGVRGDDDLNRLVDRVMELDRLRLVGLMTIGPLTTDHTAMRKAFKQLKQLFDRLSVRLPEAPLTELSMGMSGDMEPAIEEGSTMVRVGTAIFGPRED